MPESFQNQNNSREQFVSEKIPVGLPWHLLIFSIFLFGFSIFIYFGLKIGYASYLDARSVKLDKNIETLTNKVSKEEQQNLVSFYSQLVNLKKVLEEHSFVSNVYGFLEKNTLPTVYYYEANFLINDESLELKGRADSMETLVGQMTVFDKAPELEKVVLEQLNFEGKEVGFDATLTFKQDFFKNYKQ